MTITSTQQLVLDAVREAARGRHVDDTIPLEAIRERAQDNGVSYDSVNRALRALVLAGKVGRVRRGRYVLVRDEDAA